MKILAIDPGPTHSAWVGYDTDSREPWEAGETENEQIRARLRGPAMVYDVYVIERLQSYLMRVGSVVFDTQWEAARIYESMPRYRHWITRPEVKRLLLGRVAGTDADVRAALVERFGPGRRAAVGVKAEPGPCYHIKRDMWQALGVAVAWWDREGDRMIRP